VGKWKIDNETYTMLSQGKCKQFLQKVPWGSVWYIRKTPCLLFGAFSTFLVLFMKNVEKA